MRTLSLLPTPTAPTRARRRRGTAMPEFVLCLPLLMVVIALLIFLGRSMARVQRSQVMDRYEAWREATAAPGPGPDAARGHPQLNQAFLGNRAGSIEYAANTTFPGTAGADLVSVAQGFSEDTGRLAEMQFDTFDAGRAVSFRVSYPETRRFWERLDGPVSHAARRIGHDWCFVNGWRSGEPSPWASQGDWWPAGDAVTNAGVVRDVFISDLDERVYDLASSNDFAARIRGLYLDAPGYPGPVVEFR